MATPAKMVELLEAALTSNVGVKSIVVDGQNITFADRDALIRELNMWQKKVGMQSRKRSIFRGVNLNSTW